MTAHNLMDFQMMGPCPNCPFRTDIVPFLTRGRAREIADALEHKTFACHKVVYSPRKRDKLGRFLRKMEQHCAGALIVMENEGRQGDMQQIAERLGMYDHKKLQLDSPCFKSFGDFVEAQDD